MNNSSRPSSQGPSLRPSHCKYRPETALTRPSAALEAETDGNRLVTGSYGRYYASIIQGFSDEFANVAQQTNYDNYVWNGSTLVFQNRVQLSGGDSGFTPNLDLKPYHMDEFTVGYQHQIGRSMGLGVRFISREWGNLIDDVRTVDVDGSIIREVVNYDAAERSYRGLQLTAEKRFSAITSSTTHDAG